MSFAPCAQRPDADLPDLGIGEALDELVDMVVNDFPWTLTDVTGNPERTSDREH